MFVMKQREAKELNWWQPDKSEGFRSQSSTSKMRVWISIAVIVAFSLAICFAQIFGLFINPFQR